MDESLLGGRTEEVDRETSSSRGCCDRGWMCRKSRPWAVFEECESGGSGKDDFEVEALACFGLFPYLAR